MNCSICKKPVVLVPSAEARAKRSGGKPSDYTKIFTVHGRCGLKKREEEMYKVMNNKIDFIVH